MKSLENALLLRLKHDAFSVQNCVIIKKNVNFKRISILVITTGTQRGGVGRGGGGHKKPKG